MELKYKVGEEVFDLVMKRVVKIKGVLNTVSDKVLYEIQHPSNPNFTPVRVESDLTKTCPDLLLD